MGMMNRIGFLRASLASLAAVLWPWGRAEGQPAVERQVHDFDDGSDNIRVFMEVRLPQGYADHRRYAAVMEANPELLGESQEHLADLLWNAMVYEMAKDGVPGVHSSLWERHRLTARKFVHGSGTAAPRGFIRQEA